MPGFGSGSFGSGAFGQWQWADNTVVKTIPDIHKQQDVDVGGGRMTAMLESLAPSFDKIRDKIDNLGSLRDALTVPTEKEYEQDVAVLRSDDLGDGTSRVYIRDPLLVSYPSVRIGFTLTDSSGLRFSIVELNSSATVEEYPDAPIDPVTGEASPRHVVVNNITLGSTESVPFASGTNVYEENVTPVPPDDGTNVGPFRFTLAHVPLVENRIQINWTIGGQPYSGNIYNTGKYSASLTVGTKVAYETGIVDVAFTSNTPIDANSLTVNYTYLPAAPVPPDPTPWPPQDATLNSPHIIAFLGQDFGAEVDRHDPEFLQRSYVYHAAQLWSIKGTYDSYVALGKMAGFSVVPKALYRIDESYRYFLPPFNVYEIPSHSGKFYTDIEPLQPVLDELACDIIPLDTFAYYDLSIVSQAVTITHVTEMRQEGTVFRYRISLTSDEMYRAFNTIGTLVDTAVHVPGDEQGGHAFSVVSYERVDATSITLEVTGTRVPAVGLGHIDWRVAAIEIDMLPGYIEEIGIQYVGYAGIRYRLTMPIADGLGSAELGNWGFVDAYGRITWLETVAETPTETTVELILESPPPAPSKANFFYALSLTTSCDFCRASLMRVEIAPGRILETPEALAEDALGRLIRRLQQLIPAHVRVAEYVYGPGPVTAEWDIHAHTAITYTVSDDALYTAFFDEDEYPADEIQADTCLMIASGESTIDSLNILEEFVDGPNPIQPGMWTASGLWHVTGYRSSSLLKSFNYGQGESGRAGSPSAVPPNYDTGAQTTGVLASPAISIAAATEATLRFRHYAQMESGAVTDLASVVLRRVSDNAVLATYDKANLGLTTDGTTGGSFVVISRDILAAVVGQGDFRVEFSFDSVNQGNAMECWYIDDIEVQVLP